jgi:hypothetical protein
MKDGDCEWIIDIRDLKWPNLHRYLPQPHDTALGPDLKLCEDILAIQNSQGVEGMIKDGDSDG